MKIRNLTSLVLSSLFLLLFIMTSPLLEGRIKAGGLERVFQAACLIFSKSIGEVVAGHLVTSPFDTMAGWTV